MDLYRRRDLKMRCVFCGDRVEKRTATFSLAAYDFSKGKRGEVISWPSLDKYSK